ncbi:MAG TPA: hypothetical protein VMH77_06755 [Steroidobacteraceae bacterium]|nr:hypothetical protein [Steroidobacteraceae bacterium]
MKLRMGILVAALLCRSTIAGTLTSIPLADGADTVLVPAGSPVRFDAQQEHDELRFSGRFVLSGTYYYGDGEFNDGPDFRPEVMFVPDPDIAARLPYFQVRGHADAIYIENGREFARAVIPAGTLARASRKGAPHATGRVSVWVDGFAASIQCDTPNYAAHFVSVYKPGQVASLGKSPDFPC